MKKFLALPLLLLLGGCLTLGDLYNVATGVTVTPTQMYVAANSFDAIEVTATNYIVLCNTSPANPACNKTAIKKLIPAIRAGRIARNNLEAFVAANPGTPGPTTLYNALVSAIATLNQIYTLYGVGS